MAEQTCYGEHAGHICVLAMHQEFEEIKAVTKILNISVLTVDGLQMQRKISVILDH